MSASVVLQAAGAESVSSIESLLAANDLPTADVSAKPECFYVAFDDERSVGIGGLEVHGSAGVVRSVIVRESVRGSGYGAAIVEALGEAAREAGVEDLYLLTTTAESFFADQGYASVEREGVPARVRETAEFAELCPASATCMHRSLSS